MSEQMQLITTHIAMTRDMGVHGNLFGGIMMAWIDEAASVMACAIPDTEPEPESPRTLKKVTVTS